MKPDRDWDQLALACREGMACAAIRPGRYGGRYVAWCDKEANWVVLGDDDPDKYRGPQWEHVDIVAQAGPTRICPIGRFRYLLNEDGSLSEQLQGWRSKPLPSPQAVNRTPS